jgi:polysaccharide export outer membrane protein
MPAVTDPTAEEAQLEPEHLINVGDAVEIRFPFHTDFNQNQVVRDDGLINPVAIEPVMAAGRTAENLRDELIHQYAARAYDPVANRRDADRRKYLIGAGDVLEIRFEGQSEYDERVVVRPDGKISLPRVKTVVAAGKSPEDLEKELTERYKAFLDNPSITVIVREPKSDVLYVDGVPTRVGLRDVDQITVAVRRAYPPQIYVLGEVNTPGVYPYHVPMTALRALASAGGIKRSAKLQTVFILRKSGTNQPVAICVNLRPEIDADATSDVALRPYDIVVVPKTCITRVQDVLDQYVYGPAPILRNSVFNLFVDLTRTGGGVVTLPGAATGPGR